MSWPKLGSAGHGLRSVLRREHFRSRRTSGAGISGASRKLTSGSRGISQVIQKVRPSLENLASLIEEFGVIVCPSDGVAVKVSKLPFDGQTVETSLVQDRASRRSKAMSGQLASITHVIDCVQDRVLAERTSSPDRTWKDIL